MGEGWPFPDEVLWGRVGTPSRLAGARRRCWKLPIKQSQGLLPWFTWKWLRWVSNAHLGLVTTRQPLSLCKQNSGGRDLQQEVAPSVSLLLLAPPGGTSTSPLLSHGLGEGFCPSSNLRKELRAWQAPFPAPRGLLAR